MHRRFLNETFFVTVKGLKEIIQLRGLLVHHHVLIDGEKVHLLDGGFVGGVRAIGRFLKSQGMDYLNIESIILTHGHLDHTLNVAKLKELSGCQIYAPRLDEDHIAGRHPYRGLSKICGTLEWLGRICFRWRAPKVDHWFEKGDVLDLWGGLEVIGLPGHTAGHCGFRQDQLLFASDLFTNHLGKPKPPPRIFNDDHGEALASIQKAAQMDLTGIYLNHSRKMSPEAALQDLHTLGQRSGGLKHPDQPVG